MLQPWLEKLCIPTVEHQCGVLFYYLFIYFLFKVDNKKQIQSIAYTMKNRCAAKYMLYTFKFL